MDQRKVEKSKIDLIVIGNPNSGKTSLIKRFIVGQQSFSHFYTPTLGLNLQKKVIKVNNHEVSVCIWDTAGQEKFFALTKNYFKKADGVLIIFDLTDKNSFESKVYFREGVQKFWIHEVKEKSDENCCQVLIGNKLDMTNQRIIEAQTAKDMGSKLQLPYFQTSAKTGENVEEAIQFLVKQCMNKVKCQVGGVDIQNPVPKQKEGGCFSSPKQFFKNFVNKFKKQSD